MNKRKKANKPSGRIQVYKYGKKSLERLSTCHPDLQMIFREAIKYMDVSIIQGARGKAEQDSYFASGKSQKKWPDSTHNIKPGQKYSMAVDAAPYPIDWKELNRFYMFVGRIKQIADYLWREGYIEYKLRCGADWDMDGYTTDQKFHDLPHFELIKEHK